MKYLLAESLALGGGPRAYVQFVLWVLSGPDRTYRTNWMYGVDSGVICDGIGSEQRC